MAEREIVAVIKEEQEVKAVKEVRVVEETRAAVGANRPFQP